MMPSRSHLDMKLSDPACTRVCDERELYRSLPLADASVLDLGCGRADKTRAIASEFPVREIVAMEVDETQHTLNLASEHPSSMRFQYGGADAIPAADRSFDIVLMFRSLHHVPTAQLDTALAEVHRVLRPGGALYVSEPVAIGEFNDILRLFHDEEEVRAQAFRALQRAVATGAFTLESERFFNAPNHFDDFSHFERRFLQATHTRHTLSPQLHAQVREAFCRHLTPQGADFVTPVRVDVLRKAG